MGGCAKNHDKGKDGKEGKDGKDGNSGGTGALGFADPASGFQISPQKRYFYVSFGESPPSEEPAANLLQDHIQHLKDLTASASLDTCGATADGLGGFQVLLANDAEEALKLAASDPLVKQGFYKNISVREILKP
jgi:uncharacterized protein YciI